MSTVTNKQQTECNKTTEVTVLPTTVVIYAERDGTTSLVIAGLFAAAVLFGWIHMILKNRNNNDDKKGKCKRSRRKNEDPELISGERTKSKARDVSQSNSIRGHNNPAYKGSVIDMGLIEVNKNTMQKAGYKEKNSKGFETGRTSVTERRSKTDFIRANEKEAETSLDVRLYDEEHKGNYQQISVDIHNYNDTANYEHSNSSDIGNLAFKSKGKGINANSADGNVNGPRKGFSEDPVNTNCMVLHQDENYEGSLCHSIRNDTNMDNQKNISTEKLSIRASNNLSNKSFSYLVGNVVFEGPEVYV